MIPNWLNWRTVLVVIAIILVSGTIFYSQYVAGKIAREERKNVEAWVEAQRTILNSSDSASINLATKISTENNQIPIIETNEKDSITGNYLNLDSQVVRTEPGYLKNKLQNFCILFNLFINVKNNFIYGCMVFKKLQFCFRK